MSNEIRARCLSLGILCVFLLSPYAGADQILLKSKDRISGRLVAIDAEKCFIETSYNPSLVIPISQVATLHSDQTLTLQLQSGDRLVGKVRLEDSNALILESGHLGNVQVTLADIEPISLPIPLAVTLANNELSDEELQERGKGAEDGGQGSQDTLGEESKPDLGPEFLRQSTVLLQPGDFQMEFALSYARDQFVNQRTRQGSFVTALRFGLPLRMEGFLNLPVIYRTNEFFEADGTVDKHERTGIGDTSGGLNIVLAREGLKRPEFVLLLGFRAPTGEEPDFTNPREVSLGVGRWSGTLGLNMVRSYDPAVVFGGFSYEYVAPKTLDEVELEGASRFTYNFGLGFAINSQLTLSGRFIGVYQTELSFNEETIEGSDLEPMNLRFSSTYRFSKRQYLEPSVRFGLNDEAIDTIVNLSYFFNF